MSEARLERGGRFLGSRRLRAQSACVAIVLALVGSATALAASGGGGPGRQVATQPPTARTARARSNPLARRGMWIWELGAPTAATSARSSPRPAATGVSTLIIKSGDGTGIWSQFNRSSSRRCTHTACACAPGSTCTATTRSAEAQVGAAAVRPAPTACDRRRGRVRGQVRRRPRPTSRRCAS